MRRSYLRRFIRDHTFVTDGTWRFCLTQELLRLGSHCLRDGQACAGSGDVPLLRDSCLPNGQRRRLKSNKVLPIALGITAEKMNSQQLNIAAPFAQWWEMNFDCV